MLCCNFQFMYLGLCVDTKHAFWIFFLAHVLSVCWLVWHCGIPVELRHFGTIVLKLYCWRNGAWCPSGLGWRTELQPKLKLAVGWTGHLQIQKEKSNNNKNTEPNQNKGKETSKPTPRFPCPLFTEKPPRGLKACQCRAKACNKEVLPAGFTQELGSG